MHDQNLVRYPAQGGRGNDEIVEVALPRRGKDLLVALPHLRTHGCFQAHADDVVDAVRDEALVMGEPAHLVLHHRGGRVVVKAPDPVQFRSDPDGRARRAHQNRLAEAVRCFHQEIQRNGPAQ